jgi:hypothetical protein
MRKVYFIFFSLLATFSTFGQTENPKVKVILLGTFHYGATSDRGKTSFPDLFSVKRQSELESMAKNLARFGVNKFF